MKIITFLKLFFSENPKKKFGKNENFEIKIVLVCNVVAAGYVRYGTRLMLLLGALHHMQVKVTLLPLVGGLVTYLPLTRGRGVGALALLT